jgi:hypothetical protein
MYQLLPDYPDGTVRFRSWEIRIYRYLQLPAAVILLRYNQLIYNI